MHPRERLLNALTGRPVDRVPLELAGFQTVSREELQEIPNPMRRRVAERVFDESHYRVEVPSHINRMLVTPSSRIRTEQTKLPNGNRRTFGTIDTPKGKLTYVSEHSPASATSWIAKYPVENEADIEKIASVPWEPPSDLRLPDPDSLPADFPLRGILATRISTPFVCVAGMMKYEQFLELCITNLNLVRELTGICERRILDCLKIILSTPGIEYVWLGGSEWVTPPMASPAIYDALVQEQERRLIAYIHHRRNAVVHVHCHGKVRHALSQTIERGADFTEPVEPPPDGDIAMAEAKQMVAGRIALGGNVECRILCNESEQAVEAAVRAAFEGGKQRFVLRPTEGPTPRFSEREYRNYMRMVDVWEELSPMD